MAFMILLFTMFRRLVGVKVAQKISHFTPVRAEPAVAREIVSGDRAADGVGVFGGKGTKDQEGFEFSGGLYGFSARPVRGQMRPSGLPFVSP